MNCAKVRWLLLTDYLDGQASETLRRDIREHLKSCAACAAFEKAAVEKASRPFTGIQPVKPPESVWQNIKEAIAEEDARAAEYRPSFLERLRDLARDNFLIRRPQYAFAAVLTVVIAVVVFFNSPLHRRMVVEDYLRREAVYLASLDAPANGEGESELGLGTAIEKYLF
ncbi:MAG: zf-HC2 domain-containing protein [Candidatus Omnitrophica bacterium]|nr:zf-HC2 domain-containing protein [Candidatus Omnitrophota bacterium]